jgi:CRISPR-associated protein Csm3
MTASGKFFGKIIIEGDFTILTGTHIGTSKEVMEIGGVDIPVVRDPLTREPYIPGSSLKGKLRSLLEKQEFATKGANLSIDGFFCSQIRQGGNIIRHHECQQRDCPVCRLYGAAKEKNSRSAHLLVSDAHLKQESKEELETIDTGLYLTELKFENTLDRITSAASPRQIERIPRGTEFKFSLVYNQDEEKSSALFKQDLEAICNSLRLLNDDAIGGNVSRGYGRIALKNLCVIYRPLAYYKEGQDASQQIIKQDEGASLNEFMLKVTEALTS